MERPYEGDLANNFLDPLRKMPTLSPGQSGTAIFDTAQTRSGKTTMGPEAPEVLRCRGWNLWVMGWIDYVDDLMITRRTAFCREYRTHQGASEGRLYPVDDTDYEHEE